MTRKKTKQITLKESDCLGKYFCDHYGMCVFSSLFTWFDDLESIRFKNKGCPGMAVEKEYEEWCKTLTPKERENLMKAWRKHEEKEQRRIS